MFQEKTLNCRDCKQDFAFTVTEQEFFAEKGFTNDPSRCPECRAVRKQRQSNTRGGNNNYARQERRELYPAVCATCGKETQVPFQPRNDRPVYCRDCYKKASNY